jgi:hypothetical protein
VPAVSVLSHVCPSLLCSQTRFLSKEDMRDFASRLPDPACVDAEHCSKSWLSPDLSDDSSELPVAAWLGELIGI